MKCISNKSYEYAKEVWNRKRPGFWNITLGDYHEVYLVRGALPLAGVFESLRDTSLKRYKLDSAHSKEFYKKHKEQPFSAEKMKSGSMENVKKYKGTNLVISREKYVKYVMNTKCKSPCPFSQVLLGVGMGIAGIKIEKPVYLRLIVLDLRKAIIYEYCYDYIQPKYVCKVNICYIVSETALCIISRQNRFRKSLQKR